MFGLGLRMLGVVLRPDKGQPYEAARVQQVVNCPEGIQQALATCHGLAVVQGQVAGDPLDQQLFTASGWQLSQVSHLLNNAAVNSSSGGLQRVPVEISAWFQPIASAQRKIRRRWKAFAMIAKLPQPVACVDPSLLATL